MGMTIDNLCDSCTNIGCMFQSGIVRTECAFYIPPHIEPDDCSFAEGEQFCADIIQQKMVDRHFKEQLHRLKELCHDVKFSHIRREAILGDIALSLAMLLDKLEGQEDDNNNN